jgi:hypothetical protein
MHNHRHRLRAASTALWRLVAIQRTAVAVMAQRSGILSDVDGAQQKINLAVSPHRQEHPGKMAC